MAVTNAVSWRQEGLHYKKNEVFLDVVESVNLLVNSNGTVVRSEVVGALKMRAYLSGMVSRRPGRGLLVGGDGGGLLVGVQRQGCAEVLCLAAATWAGRLDTHIQACCRPPLHPPAPQPECKCGVNDKVLFEAQGRAGRQKAVDLEDVSGGGGRGRQGGSWGLWRSRTPCCRCCRALHALRCMHCGTSPWYLHSSLRALCRCPPAPPADQVPPVRAAGLV